MANKNMNAKLFINFTDSSGTGTDLYLVSGENLSTSLGKVNKFIKDNQDSGGDLAAHIATHVADDGGVHGIRVHNGALELWSEYQQQWCDPSELGYAVGNVSNLAIIQGNLSLTIAWTDPADTANATWAGTKLVMGAGTYPESVTDGTLLVNSTVRNAYSSTGYTVSNLTAGTTYYFKLFPYTNEGVITNDNANRISESAKELSSWEMLQIKVRANDMGDISIGDQYTCEQGSGELTWDVIGKNIDTPTNPNLSHTLTLRVHNLVLTPLVFDAIEAFYACQTNALNAGTYCYLAPGNWMSTYYTFTLTQSVPVGGQLVCTDNATLYSYASGSSTTPIETVSVTKGYSGTDLGKLNDQTRSGNLNTNQRRRNGSGDWKESAIRQWLNTDKPAGQWWEPQNPWDRPPAYAETMNGFMYDLDPELLEVIGKTQVTTYYYDTSTGAINGTYTTEDYFFLMSQSQVSSSYSGEGTKYTPYSDDASRKVYYNGAASDFYGLRSPNSDSSGFVCYVDVTGSMSIGPAYGSRWVVPACNII